MSVVNITGNNPWAIYRRMALLQAKWARPPPSEDEILNKTKDASFDDFNDVNDEMLSMIYNLVSQYQRVGGIIVKISGGWLGGAKTTMAGDILKQREKESEDARAANPKPILADFMEEYGTNKGANYRWKSVEVQELYYNNLIKWMDQDDKQGYYTAAFEFRLGTSLTEWKQRTGKYTWKQRIMSPDETNPIFIKARATFDAQLQLYKDRDAQQNASAAAAAAKRKTAEGDILKESEKESAVARADNPLPVARDYLLQVAHPVAGYTDKFEWKSVDMHDLYYKNIIKWIKQDDKQGYYTSADDFEEVDIILGPDDGIISPEGRASPGKEVLDAYHAHIELYL